MATFLVLVVALEHFFIMYLEMFRIPSAQAARIFGLSQSVLAQKEVKTLFSNQGLYNGFLAVGLLWAWFCAPEVAQSSVTVLFLLFVLTAALWGSFTSNKAILFKQGLPALLALLAVWL